MPMTTEEFNAIKDKMGITIKSMAEKIGKGKTATQGYASGSVIPESVAILVRKLESELPKQRKKSTQIDVSKLKSLSIEEMANICLSKEYIKEFSELAVVDVYINMKVIETRLNEKAETILDELKKQKH